MNITNREVIQSYLVTTAKYDFSVYEKRILYRLIEALQAEIQGKKLDVSFQKSLFNNDRIVTIPIKSLLNGEDDKNHKRVKAALTDLNEKKFTVEDDESWRIVRIVEKPKINKGSEFVQFEIQDDIYNAVFDFAKGFRKIELKTAMNFESVYAMRFYELFSNTQSKQTFTIAWLKTRFNLEGKYKLTANFISRVIEVAKKELDKKSPYSFDFKPVKEGRKITKIDFCPKYLSKNKDPNLERQQLQKKTSPRWDLNNNVLDALTYKFGFTTHEIKRHIDLLKKAQEEIDLVLFISKKHAKVEGKRNGKGWFLSALKSEMEANPR